MLRDYLADNSSELLRLAGEHAQLVALAVAIATLVGTALGTATYRSPRLAAIVLGTAQVLLTVPSLALFALLIPVFGLGYAPTVIALVLYGLLPVVRNTVTGLRGVDAAVVESARGVGLNQWQRLRRVELPLAWPVILAGIRVSTLLIVGIATIAAVVNGPGLGQLLLTGLNRLGAADAVALALAGTVSTLLVALAFDAVLALVGRVTISKGLR